MVEGTKVYFKQYDMVVTWVNPESDSISEGAGWVYGRYSSGTIVHASECREIATGWDALDALWPLAAILSLVSLVGGVSFGYLTRDNHYAAQHVRELADQKQKYRSLINTADQNSKQANQMDKESRQRDKIANLKNEDLVRREQSITERELNIEDTVTEKVNEITKKYEKLQDDHKKRGHKMEGLESDKIDLKKKINTLEQEILELQEKNLDLTKKNLSLKAGK